MTDYTHLGEPEGIAALFRWALLGALIGAVVIAAVCGVAYLKD